MPFYIMCTRMFVNDGNTHWCMPYYTLFLTTIHHIECFELQSLGMLVATIFEVVDTNSTLHVIVFS